MLGVPGARGSHWSWRRQMVFLGVSHGSANLSESCVVGIDLYVYSVLFKQKEFKNPKNPKSCPLSNSSLEESFQPRCLYKSLSLFPPIVPLSSSSRHSFFPTETKACGTVQGTEQGHQAKLEVILHFN